MIVGVALAGGRSRRMGRDKALLPLPTELGGGDMITSAAARLDAVCDEVVIADRGRGLVAGRRSLADGPGRGPVAGLLGAAAACPGRRLLVLACDLPRVPTAWLRRLAGLEGDWIVPRSSGRLEPLCAVYSPAALERLDERARRGLFALKDLAGEPDLEIRILDASLEAIAGEEIFTNVNTPEDFEELAAARQDRLRRGPTSR